MRMIVNFVLCDGDPDDPLAEIRTQDLRAIPAVGDSIEFDTLENGNRALLGRVASRVFRVLPYHCEIDIIAEPADV